MKKILLTGCLLLITACQSATPTLAPESAPTTTLPPTPVPVAETPTIPPAPTDSPTPAPPPLFFTDEFDTPSTFWQFFQTGGTDAPLTAIENGQLRVDISSPDTWHLGIHNAHTYSNILIRAKISASPSGSVGLVCRYNETQGWYEFNVASDGTYSALFGQWLAPGIAKYLPLATDANSGLNPGNINSEIGLSCQDNFMILYVNETLLRRLDVTRYGLAEGNIGISAASFVETPLTAFFDWVKVSEE
ncbi:MAG: hypothetical protein HZB18_02035 [Chloroflexi bacterium]|nr:hypothetical protein [Chloroflexota bacterium]